MKLWGPFKGQSSETPNIMHFVSFIMWKEKCSDQYLNTYYLIDKSHMKITRHLQSCSLDTEEERTLLYMDSWQNMQEKFKKLHMIAVPNIIFWKWYAWGNIQHFHCNSYRRSRHHYKEAPKQVTGKRGDLSHCWNRQPWLPLNKM